MRSEDWKTTPVDHQMKRDDMVSADYLAKAKQDSGPSYDKLKKRLQQKNRTVVSATMSSRRGCSRKKLWIGISGNCKRSLRGKNEQKRGTNAPAPSPCLLNCRI